MTPYMRQVNRSTTGLDNGLSHSTLNRYRNQCLFIVHYNDVIMGAIVFQITSLAIIYSTVYSCADQRKHQSSASLAFVRGIHRWPVNSPHRWPVTRKIFPFDDFIWWHTFQWSSNQNTTTSMQEKGVEMSAEWKPLCFSLNFTHV